MVVNQDTLGDRHACVRAARRALGEGRPVVIDRCNISRMQRRVWLGVSDEFGAGVGCIWLDIHPTECGARVLQRFGHPTLPATASSLKVIDGFSNRMEAPMEAEGFVLWRVHCDREVDIALAECVAALDQSETPAAPSAKAPAKRGLCDVAALATFEAKTMTATTDFKQRQDARRRTVHAMHLRGVRRQIEYYFSDRNMRHDWFFQEKIASEPEQGWLELRWILTCPRIRDVHKASAEDVLEALGPSLLIVKQAGGTHWIRRGHPLPALHDPGPLVGDEPVWYKELHDSNIAGGSVNQCKQVSPSLATAAGARPVEEQLASVCDAAAGEIAASKPGPDSEPCCAVCCRKRPRDDFSKAQLTKHRRNPTCKDCVASSNAAGPG